MKILLIIFAVLVVVAAIVIFTPIPVSVRIVNGKLSLKLWNLPYIKRLKRKKRDNKIDEFLKSQKRKVSFEDIKLRISAGKQLYYNTKPEINQLLNNLRKTAKIIYYRAVVTLGFDDPMNTGMSVGFMGGFCTELNYYLKGMLRPTSKSYLSSVPNFNKPGVDYVAEIKVQITIYKAVLFIKEVLKYKNNNQESINIITGGKI